MKKFAIAILLTIFMLFVAGCDDKKSSPADSDNTDEDTMTDEDSASGSIFGEMTQNPSGNIPLSASVAVTSKQTVKITVEVSDIKEDSVPFTKEYVPAQGAEKYSVPILGLFPDFKNSITF